MFNSKPVVPEERHINDIGYKYNSREVLYFIFIEDTGSTGNTNDSIHCLSKYPEPFSNIDIHPVSCPLVMSKFFACVYKVDPHKKFRHSDLILEIY